MPIRIGCRDGPPDRPYAIEFKGVDTPLARNPKGRYGMRPGDNNSASYADQSNHWHAQA